MNSVFGTAGPPDPVERSHWQFLWLLARITAKCQRYEEKQGAVPRWVEHGMGERFSRAEQLEHRVQMLLGIFSAKACCLSSSSRPIQLATFSRNTSMNWSRRLNAKEELCRCLLITLRAFIRYQVLSRWSRRIRRTLLTRQSPSDQRTS